TEYETDRRSRRRQGQRAPHCLDIRAADKPHEIIEAETEHDPSELIAPAQAKDAENDHGHDHKNDQPEAGRHQVDDWSCQFLESAEQIGTSKHSRDREAEDIVTIW